jgi:hypothetical protein
MMNKSYLLILFFQIMFNIFKVLEIKYTYENKIKALLLNSVWINLMALGSAYYSLDGMFHGDYGKQKQCTINTFGWYYSFIINRTHQKL